MGISCTSMKRTSIVNEYRCEYICDTDADFATLPKADVGSTAVSIATGAIRVVNTAGEWVPFGEE